MFLLRTLSVPRGVEKKSPIIEIVFFSLLAQSCTTISGVAERRDQPRIEAISAGVQKVSLVSEGQKTSPKRKVKHALNGRASWYGPGFHGKKTASGEIYDQNKLTAAHKTVPLGSKARVVNLDNGSTVEVEINDRGPYIEGRIIDLSRAAAGVLGFIQSGTAPVKIELLSTPQSPLEQRTDSDSGSSQG